MGQVALLLLVHQPRLNSVEGTLRHGTVAIFVEGGARERGLVCDDTVNAKLE